MALLSKAEVRGAECEVGWLDQSEGTDWKAGLTNQKATDRKEEKVSLSFYANPRVAHANTEAITLASLADN